MGNVLLYPLCFVDDIAAVSNSIKGAQRNQAAVEVFQDRKRLQLHPEKKSIFGQQGKQEKEHRRT